MKFRVGKSYIYCCCILLTEDLEGLGVPPIQGQRQATHKPGRDVYEPMIEIKYRKYVLHSYSAYIGI